MIDLFAGLGGWAEGGIAEGYEVVGFDIERHVYGDHRYPAQLVLQDVLTIHGAQFKDADLIVASPPCQAFSYMAMPWSRGKQIVREYESGERDKAQLTALFDACFRIQREACEAAGRFIPLVVENVRGAQKWVGPARWHFGSFYLWGDIPALMPIPGRIAKNPGFRFDGSGRSFQTESVNNSGVKAPMSPGEDSLTIGFQQIAKLQATEGFKTSGMNWSDQTKRGQDFTRIAGHQARKGEGSWFGDYATQKDKIEKGEASLTQISRGYSSKSTARKAASAMIAKIPLVLARHIARSWKPEATHAN